MVYQRHVILILFLVLFLCLVFYLRMKLSSENELIEFNEELKKKIEKFGRAYKEKD